MDFQIQQLLNQLSLSFDQETFLQLVRQYQRAGYLRADFTDHYLVRFCSLIRPSSCQNFVLISKEAAYDFAAELLKNYLPQLLDYLREREISTRSLRLLINESERVSSLELVNNYNFWIVREDYWETYQITIDTVNDSR